MSQLGQKLQWRHVRFTPDNGHASDKLACRLSARSRHHARGPIDERGRQLRQPPSELKRQFVIGTASLAARARRSRCVQGTPVFYLTVVTPTRQSPGALRYRRRSPTSRELRKSSNPAATTGLQRRGRQGRTRLSGTSLNGWIGIQLWWSSWFPPSDPYSSPGRQSWFTDTPPSNEPYF
jgi:hypothetical protein